MKGFFRAALVTLSALLTGAVTITGATTAAADDSTSSLPGSAPHATSVTGPRSFPVKTTLDGRTARTLSNHAFPDRYRLGSSVLVVCQASGGPTYAGSTIWDLTSDGLWVPDHFVSTGSVGFAPDLTRCSLPKSYVLTSTLDGRSVKKLTDHAAVDRYRDGSIVRIVCQAFGGPNYKGSYLWDRTTEGLWIPDYYVRTGTGGLVPGLPRCDADAADGSSAARLLPKDLQFSSQGASFIASYEGYVATPYEDAAGHCTIGYGHLIHRGACTGADDARWGSLDRDAAVGLLWQDAETFAAGIRSSVPDTLLSQPEFDALVSLAYNIGVGGFNSSSVRADLATGSPDYAAVPADMLKWVSSDDGPLCGLHRRRVNEGNLFTTGSYAITYPECPFGVTARIAP